MPKIVPTILLCAAGLLSLWILKSDQDVPGSYTRWGQLNMTVVWGLIALRGLVFALAFSALLASGRLSSWVSAGGSRAVLVLGGLVLCELAACNLNYYSVSEKLGAAHHWTFAILAALLPACLIASGWLPSRGLFLLALAGSLIAWIAGSSAESAGQVRRAAEVEANQLDTATQQGMSSLLAWADPMYGPDRTQKLLERIEQQPDWIHQVAQQLDDPGRASAAMFVLCRKPALLDEGLQERCWSAVRATTERLDKQLRETGSGMLTYGYQLLEAVKGLAGCPCLVRERHRKEFAAAREVLAKLHATALSFPELEETAWATVGNK